MLHTFVVPHAPLLVDIPGRPHPVPDIPSTVASLDLSGDVVIVTPHGRRAGIYRSTAGSLSEMGLPAARVELDNDERLSRELSEAWDVPFLEEPLDHGAVVPSLLLSGLRRVTVCALSEWTDLDGGDPSQAVEQGASLGAALAEIGSTRDLSVVIGGHTSAAVTPRAPLTERPQGKEVDQAVVDALGSSPGRLRDISTETWERAGSCGAGPLRALAELAEAPLEILHHSAPYGVGYVVARSGS